MKSKDISIKISIKIVLASLANEIKPVKKKYTKDKVTNDIQNRFLMMDLCTEKTQDSRLKIIRSIKKKTIELIKIHHQVNKKKTHQVRKYDGRKGRPILRFPPKGQKYPEINITTYGQALSFF